MFEDLIDKVTSLYLKEYNYSHPIAVQYPILQNS